MLNDILGQINDLMYTYLLLFLLLGTGLYFSIRSRFAQVRLMKEGFRILTEKAEVEDGKKQVSSFQALMISTASRVGTGNIAGIATAIAAGGPGAVFWMWVMAVIGGASAFIESTLAVNRRYKRDGEQEADFISCVTFGKSAEFAQKYLHKGMRIVIGGRISTGNYKDKDGKTIYTTDVIVEEHEFAQNKDNGVGADSSETPKTDKDGFMEAPEGEVPFD